DEHGRPSIASIHAPRIRLDAVYRFIIVAIIVGGDRGPRRDAGASRPRSSTWWHTVSHEPARAGRSGPRHLAAPSVQTGRVRRRSGPRRPVLHRRVAERGGAGAG